MPRAPVGTPLFCNQLFVDWFVHHLLDFHVISAIINRSEASCDHEQMFHLTKFPSTSHGPIWFFFVARLIQLSFATHESSRKPLRNTWQEFRSLRPVGLCVNLRETRSASLRETPDKILDLWAYAIPRASLWSGFHLCANLCETRGAGFTSSSLCRLWLLVASARIRVVFCHDPHSLPNLTRIAFPIWPARPHNLIRTAITPDPRGFHSLTRVDFILWITQPSHWPAQTCIPFRPCPLFEPDFLLLLNLLN